MTAPLRFNGPEYAPEHDRARLSDQHARIRELMLDGVWRTIREVSQKTGAPEASASAQLRHMRKDRFGGFVVERRTRGDRKDGLFEYRVRAPDLFTAPREPVSVRTLQRRVRELEQELAATRLAAGFQ